jgi:hypothetical protein
MGYGLTAFLMADERDLHIFGSRRRKLLSEVLEVREDDFDSLDDQFDVEDEGLIGHAKALRELFAGKISHPEQYAAYGWAFEVYCDSMGDRLHNGCFCPCGSDWLETLDKHLKKHKVPLRLDDLISDWPIPFPKSNGDFPFIGHWPNAKMLAALKPLAQAIAAVKEPNVAEALQEVAGWLDQATAVPGSVLVGFFG